MKRKTTSKRKNPTPKENLLTAIGTGCIDIGRLISDPSLRSKLQTLSIDELAIILRKVDDLSWTLKKLQIGFSHFGEKSGLR
jgi:hypothetical protein